MERVFDRAVGQRQVQPASLPGAQRGRRDTNVLREPRNPCVTVKGATGFREKISGLARGRAVRVLYIRTRVPRARASHEANWMEPGRHSPCRSGLQGSVSSRPALAADSLESRLRPGWRHMPFWCDWRYYEAMYGVMVVISAKNVP